jgi:hypothetical protein
MQRFGIIAANRPPIAGGSYRPDRNTSLYLRAEARRAPQQRIVEPVTRQRERLERQHRGNFSGRVTDRDPIDLHCAKRCRVNAQAMQVRLRFDTEEFAANLVMGPVGSLYDHDLAP